MSRGSHQEYKLGEEVQGDYAMQCLIKHDQADVGSPLLEAAPVQDFDHSGDTCFTVVVVINIPCCPSVDHLYLVFGRLRVGSHMAAAYSNWGLTKVLILSLPILRFLQRKPKDAFAFL